MHGAIIVFEPDMPAGHSVVVVVVEVVVVVVVVVPTGELQ
jgi:hypothetical protein